MRRGCIIRLSHGFRFAVACPAGTHFFPVSPTLDNVCCRCTANLCACFCSFLTACGDCFSFFSGLCQTLDVQMDLFVRFLSGLACRPTDSPIARFCGFSVFWGTPIMAGGLVSLVRWFGLLSGVVFSVYEQL